MKVFLPVGSMFLFSWLLMSLIWAPNKHARYIFPARKNLKHFHEKVIKIQKQNRKAPNARGYRIAYWAACDRVKLMKYREIWTECFSNTLSNIMWNTSSENTCKKDNFRSIFFSVFFVNKNRNIKNHDLPATARLNKAKLTKIDNDVRISYRNYFPLSFSSLVVELDVG